MAGKLQIYANGCGELGLALVAYLRDLCDLLWTNPFFVLTFASLREILASRGAGFAGSDEGRRS